jgi:guanosine-3',5'-bis(diphosphate) 3'-pyrophosphohydrolase
MVEIDIEKENKEILNRYRKLLHVAKPFLKDNDAKIIKKAFNTSAEAHKDMRRKSGEPYIYHPIAVAQIVVEEIGLGTTAIVAALLHDVVEDTELEISDIERDFGLKVANIIDGLTKISGASEHGSSQQAENFKKMILTLSDDVRVILIKLADRLHNMRTLESMPRDKQLKIASETIFLYAPLAHRLGLNAIKSELEDLYLKYSNPSVYKSIQHKMQQSKIAREKFIKDFIAPVEIELLKSGLDFTIKGRMKSIYSIWNKMKNTDIPFEQVYDLFAIRIILNTPVENEKSACWQAYSIVTDFYKPNPDRLRDWISTSRSNGYESLHSTVMSNTGQWVEVQVRTKRMDDIAEKGYAAHWKYKEQDGASVNTESGLEQWIGKVREMLEKSDANALEFLEDFRGNLFNEEVYFFTPKGDLKMLPTGATALDFAFEIHTQIGKTCIGAKVNHKIVPINYVLNNGDQVEILNSSKQKPAEEWLKFAFCAKSKAKIKDYLKNDRRQIAIEGKVTLLSFLQDIDIVLNPEIEMRLLTYFNEHSLVDICVKVARKQIVASEILRFKTEYLQLLEQRNNTIIDAKTFKEELKKIRGVGSDTLVIGDDLDKIDYSLSTCCKPIPGDDVVGFVTIAEGIKIHRTICPNAIESMSNYGTRIIKAKWNAQSQLSFLAGLKLEGTDRKGLMSDTMRVISDELNMNIRSIKMNSEEGTFGGDIMVYVHDTDDLALLITKLKDIQGVMKVSRYDNY